MIHVTSFRWLLGLMALVLPLFLTAQLSYTLDIPEIPGEVRRAGFEDQIEITSFSYGISTEEETGRTSPTVTQGCFLLGKTTDRATPLLFEAVTKHTRFNEMTLTAYRTDARSSRIVITYQLTNVVVKKWETGAENGEGIQEVIGLVPAEVEITYYYYNDDGSLSGEYSYSYDFSTGV
ncbi:Hcp family type VI secretion system effector [Lewinella sp. IMCC34191]|uniref:Hcp family type VI secretion system effector n=1 Tax=Lewinella sp. IMCC34191 TaxID=2259172 RepID=UPI000E24453C|nr:type VI secretion system tube protein Hcp [Lewinella sp. IMCC34191]